MEANASYYCLHRFHWLPSKFLSLPPEERAFILAAIQLRVKAEEKLASSKQK